MMPRGERNRYLATLLPGGYANLTYRWDSYSSASLRSYVGACVLTAPQDLPEPVHTGLVLDFCFTAASFASPDCMTPELAAPQTDTVELTA